MSERLRPLSGGLIYQPEAPIPGDVPEHALYQKARADLIDRDMVVSRDFQEMQWRALRIGVHPLMIEWGRLFVARMAAYGIPVYCNEYVRTAARQRQLVADGLSKAPPEKAPHVWGCAGDFVHAINGWQLSKKQWEFFGVVGKELAIQRSIPIVWGGDWPPIVDKVGWDPAHWQLKNWRAEMTGYPFMPITKGNTLK